ncbi:MAG TPA: ribosome recycling factor [Candidatus Krumholzibacteria bacterium]|nr:ribosome recycling factor [Candidatus Krumholzibacteria bacterium]HPD71117.1 ribosome recycling factor [Candidatus Krumholzibacteria bacterium]HRY39183.1 ribosome recycling factor [Candidatus Krumholzibacteria bacterium]
MSKDVLENLELEMDAALDAAKRRLSKLRTGKASPALLDGLMVDYYGAPTPLKQLATVAAPEARQLAVKPFDRGAIGAIERAIQASNLGLNPANDGMMIRIQIPELTQERRREFTKLAREIGEDGKVAVRRARQDANDQLKKEQKDGLITEDQHHDERDRVQKLTDRFCADIDEVVRAKEAEIMEI